MTYKIIWICASNIRAPKYMKETLAKPKGEINRSTIIIGDLHTSISVIDRTTRQEINKETEDWTNTVDWIDLADVYRTIHLTAAE